jgi:hypothetical protein
LIQPENSALLKNPPKNTKGLTLYYHTILIGYFLEKLNLNKPLKFNYLDITKAWLHASEAGIRSTTGAFFKPE